MIDPNQPVELEDGTPLKLKKIYEELNNIGFARADGLPFTERQASCGPHDQTIRIWNFDGSRAYGTGMRIRNVEPNLVDWTQPIELDDGTPLRLYDDGSHETELHIDIRADKPHPAFSTLKTVGWANKKTGLVGSNHKYHVRNRGSAFKLTDRVTTTCFSGQWTICDFDGTYFTLMNSTGARCGNLKASQLRRIEPLPQIEVVYQRAERGYIRSGIFKSEEAARSIKFPELERLIKITRTDGKVTNVEMMS